MGGKEYITYLYLIVEEEIDDDQLLQAAKVPNPVLIVRGKNIHEPFTLYCVVIEKETIMHRKSFLDGILITFLSYHIFGILYPPEGTLETIQQLFLKINPQKGTKSGGKGKVTVHHPKATKLIEEVYQYSSESDDI